MRLLIADQQGQLKLTKDLGDPLPPYAILSHTWGEDEDEVTFDDIEKGRGVNKIGYAKLKFCMRQALKDDLKYVWVDTCCINKASQTELSKAITSMFKWYQNAAKCYVYLSDVTIGSSDDDTSAPAWETMFHESRWFTRGWTLQELLAPPSVEFFARNGQLLGTKKSLENEIHQTTGIPLAALRATDLSHFAVEQRLQWATDRNTKEPEDRAYCLIGLCGISMSLRYGEGDNAFRRLEAKVRKVAEVQGHEESDKLNDDDRQRNDNILASLSFPEMDSRRQQIIPPAAETFQWLLADPLSRSAPGSRFASFLRSDSDSDRIFWISGIPGSGKSSLMSHLLDQLERGIGEVLQSHNPAKIIASYFFWSPSTNILQKSVSGMMRTLLYSLFEQDTASISDAVTPRRWNYARSQNDTTPPWTEKELWTTFANFVRHRSQCSTILLLIDGLDEIEGRMADQESLVAMVQNFSELPNVKLCVSSRPLPIFVDALGHMPLLRLQDLNYSDISRYVHDTMYAQRYFRALSVHHREGVENLLNTICNRAAGVFLWARLVVQDMLHCLRDGGDFATLEKLLEDVPEDLELYFQRIWDSIDERYLTEASVFLQIALWQERDFTLVHSLRLVDISLFEGTSSGFPDSAPSLSKIDLKADKEVQMKLRATFRKLQSRCKSLLVCHYLPGYTQGTLAGFRIRGEDGVTSTIIDDDAVFMMSQDCSHQQQYGFFAFDFSVEFLHRSVRDYLSTPNCIGRIHALTHGAMDVRRYLCNAWLHEAEALMMAGRSRDLVSHLLSHVISAAATPSMKSAQGTLDIMMRLNALIYYILEEDWSERGLYIDTCLAAWIAEKSSLLTFAIDFDVQIYIAKHLTSHQIQDKTGRPLLDYVLRPRFIGMFGQPIGLTMPDPLLVARMLQLGANPNESFDGCSLFSLFICLMNDCLRPYYNQMTLNEISCFFETTAMLVQHISEDCIHWSWLCHYGHFEAWDSDWRHDIQEEFDSDEVFRIRWPDLAPPIHTDNSHGGDFYRITDLLQHFKIYFGSRMDDLISVAARRPGLVAKATSVSMET
jgi:hypothetical protein